MPKLVVCTFLYRGWRPIYEPAHVTTLQRMVKLHLHQDHTFLCITDQPEALTCDTMRLWDMPPMPNKPMPQDGFCRLRLFSSWAREMFEGAWLLHLDLDTVIMDTLDPLLDGWPDFRILQGSGAPYNGSLWLLRTGAHPEVWDQFDSEQSPQAIRGAGYRGSDQGWLSLTVPNAPLYTKQDGIYKSGRKGIRQQPPNVKLVAFPGFVKPWDDEARRLTPWAWERYRLWQTAISVSK